MKIWMQITAVFATVMMFTLGAQAQQWGTGQWGGMQGCAYPQRAGDGAESDQDLIKEKQEVIKEAQKQLKSKQNELKSLKRELNASRQDVEQVISEDFSSFVFEHIENERACTEYKGMGGTSDGTQTTGTDGGQTIETPDANLTEIQAFQMGEWRQICDMNKRGSVMGVVCDGKRFRVEEKTGATAKDCKKGLVDYRKNYARSQRLETEVKSLERAIANGKRDLQSAKEQVAEERRERAKEQLEGGICVNCATSGSGYVYQKPQTDWANVAANVGTGLLVSLMGYKQQQMVTEANASIGWPTQSYPAGGAAIGAPFFLNGLYGALGGGVGAGAFGCGNMSAGGSVFGPGFSYNPLTGGGMYLPGMSPWGIAGPNMMYPGGMYPGGIANFGLMGGAMGMNPYGMGAMGAMGMNPYGMGAMGALGGGLANFGLMGGAMGMNPYGMGAMGMNPYGMGAMGGMGLMGGAMGGMGLMGGAMGMNPYGMGAMGMDMGSMQMQQQMMQMQMQQQQYYVQQQQQYMTQQMERQRVVQSLQTELYSLMSRIQQVQMGYGSSYLGVTGGTGVGGTTGWTGPGTPVNGVGTGTTYPGVPGTTGNLPASR